MIIHSKKIIAIIFAFFFLLPFFGNTKSAEAASISPCGSANSGGNCHVTINNALQAAASGSDKVVHLNDGTYWIDGVISVPSGVTLEGSRNAVIKLVNGANWAFSSSFCYDSACASPMFTSTGSNITFKGFTIDGNCKNQGRPRGKEYYKMVAMRGSSNVTFTGMAFVDGCADGVNFRNGSNVTYSNNYVDCVGHEALYALRTNNVKFFGNTVYTCTNTAIRMDYSSGGQIYKNYIKSSTKASSTGPGIELAHYDNNVDIYQNVVEDLRGGAAVWMISENSSSYGVKIHDNCFRNVGQGSWAYGNAAVIIEQFKDTMVYNNYINDGGTAAVKSFAHYGQISGPFRTTVNNNTVISTGSLVLNNVSNSSRYVFSTSGNCIGSASGSCPTSCDAATGGVSPSPDGGGVSDPGDPSTPTTTPTTPENCNVTGDEDEDGAADCEDSDCESAPRCQPAPPYIYTINPAPVPIISQGVSIIRAAGSTVTLNGENSFDMNGTISSYSWDFDASNGITSEATGTTVTTNYTNAGTYTATLTVRDSQGAISSRTISIIVVSCNGECDADGDEHVSVIYGGDDCDDNNASVVPGENCVSKCAGNMIVNGTCQANGQCLYEDTGSVCENMGDSCRMDQCQDTSTGAACAVDVSDDLCRGGIIPCNKQLDNPDTAWKENEQCSACSMVLMGQLTIEFLVQIAAVFATLAIIIGGFLYIFAVGRASTTEKAKSIIKYTIIGFIVVFIAWSIISSVLATMGYTDPLGGEWYSIC